MPETPVMSVMSVPIITIINGIIICIRGRRYQMDIQKLVTQYYNSIQKRIRDLEDMLEGLPDGALHIKRRGGQVFYLHNFIDSIDRIASDLGKEFPDARIAVAHGRMEKEEI